MKVLKFRIICDIYSVYLRNFMSWRWASLGLSTLVTKCWRVCVRATGFSQETLCAARQRRLAGDQVAKLVGHITWSCLLRFSALSLINAGYRFARTFGPRSGRLWPSRRARTPLDGVIAATSHLQPCQPLVDVGPCYRCLGWSTQGLRSHAPLV